MSREQSKNCPCRLFLSSEFSWQHQNIICDVSRFLSMSLVGIFSTRAFSIDDDNALLKRFWQNSIIVYKDYKKQGKEHFCYALERFG